MIKLADDSKIVRLIHIGISVWRVTNPSKKAATTKTGMRQMMIFTLSFAACLRDNNLLYVPGKMSELPIINPAQLAITMAESSNVP